MAALQTVDEGNVIQSALAPIIYVSMFISGKLWI